MFRPRKPIVLSALLGLCGCGYLGLCGCGYLRTPYLLNTLNSGVSSGPVTARASIAERVAREVRLHVEDSYFDPKAVGDWLASASARSEPIAAELECLRKSSMAGAGPCYEKFDADAPKAWGLPPAPTASGANGAFPASSPDTAYLTEADVERFAANARWIASSLLVLEDSLGAGSSSPKSSTPASRAECSRRVPTCSRAAGIGIPRGPPLPSS
jgi:hypothetical protein